MDCRTAKTSGGRREFNFEVTLVIYMELDLRASEG